MLGTGNFIKYLIILFVDVLIIVNVIYAFDLGSVLPSVYAGGMTTDLTDSYFGIDSFINAFLGYFDNNTILTGMKQLLTNFFTFIQKISLQEFLNARYELPNWVSALVSFANLFLNIGYQFFLIIYGLFLFVYALCIAVNFVIFIISIASGYYATPLPKTYGLHVSMMTMIAQLPF